MSAIGTRRAVYPGSFNPPTIAHLAISRATLEQRDVTDVVWMMSEVALAKETAIRPTVSQRLEVLTELTADHSWLTVAVTSKQLVADIVEGFDVVIMGADKWHQINERRWYPDDEARQSAIDRLPELAIAPRGSDPIPAEHAITVHGLDDISSSAARAGAWEHALPQAFESGLWN